MRPGSKRLLLFGAAAAGAAALAGAAVHSLFGFAARRKPPVPMPHVTDLNNNPYADEIRAGTDWLLAQEAETVTIKSRDGLTLTGHYLPAENAQRTVIMMHGWRSSWYRDFGLGAKCFHEDGCNLLLAEQRSHGGSDGEYIGFGVLERYDCADWVNYVMDRFGTEMPIYLDGISMGATTVLMASGLGLPKQVRGIIADCGFTSPKEIMEHVLHKYIHKAGVPATALASAISRRSAGYSFSEYSTIDALAVNETPVLFAHGSADDFVPAEMTFRNFAACKAPKELLISNCAGHGMSFLYSGEAYRNAIARFFRKYDHE